MTGLQLWAVVLVESTESTRDLPYIVRDHTASQPHRLFVFESEAEAQVEMAHFAESFPSSTYAVVPLNSHSEELTALADACTWSAACVSHMGEVALTIDDIGDWQTFERILRPYANGADQ